MKVEIWVNQGTQFGNSYEIERKEILIDTNRRLNGNMALKILKEQYPEIVAHYILKNTDKRKTFTTLRTVGSTQRCNYHYIWREYNISESE